MGRGSSGKRGVLLGTLGNLSAPLVSLITAPLLAQALGVDGRGVLAASVAPFALAAAGLTLGLPEAMTYFVARRMARRKDVLSIGLIASAAIGILGSIGIFALSGILSGSDPRIAGLITVIGLAVAPAIMAGTVRGYVRGLQLWGLIAIEQVLASTTRLLAIGMLATLNVLTPLSAGVVTAASSFVGVLVYLWIPLFTRFTKASSPSDSVPHPNSKELSATIGKFGIGVWVGSVAGVLLSKLDQVLLLPLSSAAALGLYAVAVSIADVVRVFNTAVRDVVFSMQSARRDDESLGQASRVSTIFTAAAALAVWGASWILVPPLFGDEFRPSIDLIGVLLAGTVVGNVGSVLAAGLSARGKPLLRSIAILIGVGVNVVGIFLLVPILGAMGAAIAAAVANAITGMVVLAFAHRYFDLSPALFVRFRPSDLAYTMQAIHALLRRNKSS